MIGRKFEDKNGNVIQVVDVDGDVAHLKDGARIATNRLMDTNYYSEYIDPESFATKQSSFYSSLTESIKNIDSPNGGGNPIGGNNPQPYTTNAKGDMVLKSVGDPGDASVSVVESHSTARDGIITASNEEELERKKREMVNNPANARSQASKQASQFADIVGDDPELQVEIDRETTVSMYDENERVTHTETNNPEVKNDQPQSQLQPQTQTPQPKQDPMYEMFSAVKRSVKVSIPIKINEMIPKKDFIKMWEENYEKSIIDFLADEFYQKLMEDPSIIRDQISEAIKNKVYPPKRRRTTKKTASKKSTTKKTVTKKSTTKSTTADKKDDK